MIMNWLLGNFPFLFYGMTILLAIALHASWCSGLSRYLSGTPLSILRQPRSKRRSYIFRSSLGDYQMSNYDGFPYLGLFCLPHNL